MCCAMLSYPVLPPCDACAGVEHLYVHVVADNTPAHNLYLRAGYEQEAEETEAFAHSLRRPRRLILHKQL